jgi:hypothetical protein
MAISIDESQHNNINGIKYRYAEGHYDDSC